MTTTPAKIPNNVPVDTLKTEPSEIIASDAAIAL